MATVLSYRFRQSADVKVENAKQDATAWASDETLDGVRMRLADKHKGKPALAEHYTPQLWLCDENGTLHAKGDVDLLWTPATAVNDDDASLLFVQPWARNKPKAFILFTFPQVGPASATDNVPALQTILLKFEEMHMDGKKAHEERMKAHEERMKALQNQPAALVRALDQRSEAEAVLSEVSMHALSRRVLEPLAIFRCPDFENADLTAKPAGYKPFVWTGAHESAHADGAKYTNGGYLKHISSIIKSGVSVLGAVEVDASIGEFKNLHGKIDVCVLPGTIKYNQHGISARAFVGIQLKKNDDMQRGYIQTEATLLALDYVTNQFVLAVLTDLCDQWTLMWLAKDPPPVPAGHYLYRYTCSPATAIQLINDFVRVAPKTTGTCMPSFPAPNFFKVKELMSPLPVIRATMSRAFADDTHLGSSGSGFSGDGLAGDGSGSPSSSSTAVDATGAKTDSTNTHRTGNTKENEGENVEVVVNGIVLNHDQQTEYEQYLMLSLIERDPLWRACGLYAVPPPFLLEQEL